MRITTLSSKGQITIPKDLQNALKIKPLSKLYIYAAPDSSSLLIKPLHTSIVDQTAGSLLSLIPPHKRNQPFLKVFSETKKKTAQKLAKKA